MEKRERKKEKTREKKRKKKRDKTRADSKSTLARASRDASASAAMALWSCTGSFTSLISTRSTFIPQSSVASSRVHCSEERRPTKKAQPCPVAKDRPLGRGADKALGEIQGRG